MLNKNKHKKIFKIILLTLVMSFFIFPIYTFAQSGADDLKAELEAKQKKIDALQEKIDEYQENINYYEKQSLSLSRQVQILNNELNKIETEIELKQNQIEETNLEIQDTQEKIAKTEENIDLKKEQLKKFLQQINRLDEKSSLEVILSADSFSEYYNHLHTLEILQDDTSDSLNEVKQFKADLEQHIASLEEKKKSIEKLIADIEVKKDSLASRNYAKQDLLQESSNSEAKFKSLVAELKAEQSQINAEIIALEKQIRSELGGDTKFITLTSSDFIWPVPNAGITAYFHDPSYPFRYIFEHPAIDIKSRQGSPIKAAASGYVGKVHIIGTNYGYIMLIHANGFSTVYGHTSGSYVKEGDYVAQGETIGLSGGMPGTTGSGRLSTGPHLHFEVRKNGIPVNPLDYLP